MDPDALSVDCGICFMPYEGEVYMVSIIACNTSSFNTATTNYLWIVASNIFGLWPPTTIYLRLTQFDCSNLSSAAITITKYIFGGGQHNRLGSSVTVNEALTEAVWLRCSPWSTN